VRRPLRAEHRSAARSIAIALRPIDDLLAQPPRHPALSPDGGEGKVYASKRDLHAAVEIADAHAQKPGLAGKAAILQAIAIAKRCAYPWMPDILVTQHLDL
jgi:hypothetical protein